MSTFRVRNLLIQVLEPATCEAVSAEQAVACGNSAELPQVGIGVWGCGCSLHFDTGCNIWRFSLLPCRLRGLSMECNPRGVTLVVKNDDEGLEACAELKSVCQRAADSDLQAVPPVGVCFQSDEPRLDPNSLADLGTLRRQLTAALQIVHTRESTLSEALLPRSAEEVEQAEAMLSSALEDLKASKHYIQSQVSGAPSRSSKKTAPKKNSSRK